MTTDHAGSFYLRPSAKASEAAGNNFPVFGRSATCKKLATKDLMWVQEQNEVNVILLVRFWSCTSLAIIHSHSWDSLSTLGTSRIWARLLSFPVDLVASPWNPGSRSKSADAVATVADADGSDGGGGASAAANAGSNGPTYGNDSWPRSSGAGLAGLLFQQGFCVSVGDPNWTSFGKDFEIACN